MRSATKCPKFTAISLACDGDENALKSILEHYDAYTSKSSLRPLYDEYGHVHVAVDSELKGLIRAALVTKILKFEIEVA